MREVWLTPMGNLRVRRVVKDEYTSYFVLMKFFSDLADKRHELTSRGFVYLGEL